MIRATPSGAANARVLLSDRHIWVMAHMWRLHCELTPVVLAVEILRHNRQAVGIWHESEVTDFQMRSTACSGRTVIAAPLWRYKLSLETVLRCHSSRSWAGTDVANAARDCVSQCLAFGEVDMIRHYGRPRFVCPDPRVLSEWERAPTLIDAATDLAISRQPNFNMSGAGS